MEFILNTIKDFFSPLGNTIIGALLGYYFARRLDLKSSKLEEDRKSESKIDYLVVQLDKISGTLELLIQDLDQRKFYQLKNIQKILITLPKVNQLIEQILFITDKELRRDILVVYDDLASLSQDLEILENLMLDYRRKRDNNKASVLQRLREYDTEFLKIGLGREGTTIVPIGQEQKAYTTYAQNAINDLDKELGKIDREYEEDEKYYNDKKNTLSLRIMTAQNKISELNSKLRELNI